jgi:hypothetical protein
MKNFMTMLALLMSFAMAVEGPKMLEPTLGETFVLRHNDTAVFQDLTISITDIQDSRCPKNIDCYWTGEVKVTVQVSSATNEETILLTTPPVTGTNNAKVGNYKLTLLDVAPYPGEVVSTDTPTTIKLLLEKAP